MLNLLRWGHRGLVHTRRVRTLARQVAELLPAGAQVADVGCGDGEVTALVMSRRPDVVIDGYDVMARRQARVDVHAFDGRTLPIATRGIDAVMLIDVLHHCPDPMALLRECVRVTRKTLVIKDHRLSRPGAALTLALMDWIGNRPHGVALPHAYWPEARWLQAWKELGLTLERYETRLGLYPWPASWIFERGLHFVAKLTPTSGSR